GNRGLATDRSLRRDCRRHSNRKSPGVKPSGLARASKGGYVSIATKQGDRGQTSLVGGARVSKADLRVEAYGNVDELNAARDSPEVSVRMPRSPLGLLTFKRPCSG